MIRSTIATVIAVTLMLGTCVPFSQAAEKKARAAAASSAATEALDSMRKTLEDQSKQIEALTEQVAHLTQLLEAHNISTTATTTSQSPVPVHTPETSAATATGTASPAPETPGTHVVAKGETLTSIAKHYKITVGELLKVNKIENDRMLQIGQTLAIPTPAPSTNPPETKENQ